MNAEFIVPSDPRWSRLLAHARHDVYHLPGYVELSAQHEQARPVAFYAETEESQFLAPLLIRKIPPAYDPSQDYHDATTPYGYATPLLIPSANPVALKSFLESFRRVCASLGIVTAFFRLHPLLELPRDALLEYGDICRRGETVSVDLSMSFGEIWAQTRRDHKKNIRRLIREGFKGYIDQWDFYDEFISLYWQNMERVAADKYYFFSRDYFVGLRTALGDHLHFCTVLSPNGKLAAAGLFTSVGDIAQAFLSCSDDSFDKYAPSKLMTNHARFWAKAAGHRVLHLGGGFGSRPGPLFNFKAGFSELRHTFTTYSMVMDEQAYAELNQRWHNLNTETETQCDTDFFPLYRQCGRGIALENKDDS